MPSSLPSSAYALGLVDTHTCSCDTNVRCHSLFFSTELWAAVGLTRCTCSWPPLRQSSTAFWPLSSTEAPLNTAAYTDSGRATESLQTPIAGCHDNLCLTYTLRLVQPLQCHASALKHAFRHN